MKPTLRELLFSAIIAAVLILPLFGLRLDSESGSLAITTDWPLAIAFWVGAVLLRAAILLRPRAVLNKIAIRVQLPSGWSVPTGRGLILLMLVLPFIPGVDRRLLDMLILIITYVTLGWGLSIMVGMVGLLDLGYIAFYAIGAYAFALLAVDGGWSFWQTLPIVIAASGGAAFLIGGPILRLRGDYFAIVSLGFAEVLRITLINWQSLTHGPDGVTGIPRPSVFGMASFNVGDTGLPLFAEWLGIAPDPMHRLMFIYYLLLIFAAAVMLLLGWLRRSTFGLAFEAIREDEVAAQAMGINRPLMKIIAYALAAMIAGVAGAFFAARQGFISPESFNPMESFTVLAIVVLGGMGSRLGVVIAAVILIGLPELFREFAEYRMLAFGLALVLIMLWRPQGLLAHRRPTQTLLNKGAI
jgi:branched-chain amino acid transport system permease protein